MHSVIFTVHVQEVEGATEEETTGEYQEKRKGKSASQVSFHELQNLL